jgi:hypothetical protein
MHQLNSDIFSSFHNFILILNLPTIYCNFNILQFIMCYSHTRDVIGPVFQHDCRLVAVTLPQGGINDKKKLYFVPNSTVPQNIFIPESELLIGNSHGKSDLSVKSTMTPRVLMTSTNKLIDF